MPKGFLKTNDKSKFRDKNGTASGKNNQRENKILIKTKSKLPEQVSVYFRIHIF